MEFETILYAVDDRIATITLNRPEQLNAISPQMTADLRRAYAAAESDDAVWTLIVTGSGRAFCAGADVGESKTTSAWCTRSPTSPRIRSGKHHRKAHRRSAP